jgi:hypothetical protein
LCVFGGYNRSEHDAPQRLNHRCGAICFSD